MTDSQQTRPLTEAEQLKMLFDRTAKLNDAVSALLAPAWGSEMEIIPTDHPLYVGEQPATPAATDLHEQVRAAIEDEIYEYRERTMFWPETGGVTQEIARLATRGAMKVLQQQTAAVQDDGPSVREAAANDARWWGGEKTGE